MHYLKNINYIPIIALVLFHSYTKHYLIVCSLQLLWFVLFAGLGKPRGMSVTGRQLPSPRLVSRSVHSDTNRPHTHYTLMVMQVAQITDHDLTFTPVNKGYQLIRVIALRLRLISFA